MFVKQRQTSQGENVTVNGWFQPPIDLRDYNDRHDRIKNIAWIFNVGRDKAVLLEATEDDLPKIVDLRSKFPPIRNQGNLGSCVAFGTIAVFEYHALKVFEKYTKLSELAHYKNMRFLMQVTGDTGSYVRIGMGAAKALGIPPNKYWVYDTRYFDNDIPASVQMLGRNYEGITYLRHDAGTNTPPACAVLSAKKYLASGLPFVFAFYGFQSFDDDGKVPLPGPNEYAEWGHCVAAVGYDDTIVIPTGDGKSTTRGAFIFRNSWGKNWGIKGYGYLPYEYFLRQYAMDMWTVIDAKWLDSGLYGF